MRGWFGVVLSTLSICASTVVFAVTIPPEEPGQQAALCRDKWTKRGVLNQEMFDYCIKAQKEGYSKFHELAEKYKDEQWIQTLVNQDVDKWTKRGIREDTMVAFELDQQLDAFEDLVYFSKQQGFDKAKFDSCYNRYGLEFEVVRGCYKGDIPGGAATVSSSAISQEWLLSGDPNTYCEKAIEDNRLSGPDQDAGDLLQTCLLLIAQARNNSTRDLKQTAGDHFADCINSQIIDSKYLPFDEGKFETIITQCLSAYKEFIFACRLFYKSSSDSSSDNEQCAEIAASGARPWH
jgi:hypothetical protein